MGPKVEWKWRVLKFVYGRGQESNRGRAVITKQLNHWTNVKLLFYVANGVVFIVCGYLGGARKGASPLPMEPQCGTNTQNNRRAFRWRFKTLVMRLCGLLYINGLYLLNRLTFITNPFVITARIKLVVPPSFWRLSLIWWHYLQSFHNWFEFLKVKLVVQ